LEKPKLYRNAEPVRSAVERYATRVRVRPMKLGNVFFISFLVLLEARVKTQKNGAPKKHGPKNIKKRTPEKKRKKQKQKKEKKQRKKEKKEKRKKGKKEKGKKERKEGLCFSKSSRNKLQHRRVRLVPFALQPRLDPP
jgi:uncharacterized membrane protein YdbT with pleckstrin-like domain